tara:strand:- start:440 stop:664 length:225 start_codon:yes stop_codon:yes gene_type:complete
VKEYLKAFVVMALLNFAGLFGLGFCVGIIMAIGGNLDGANQLESAAWFNSLILLTWPVIAFFAFKFSVDKFIKK